MLSISASDAHALKGFGTVHCVTVPHYGPGLRAFPLLHSLCSTTPCNLTNFSAEPYVSPSERKLINRTNNKKGTILITKTADGMLFHISSRLIGGMHGKSFFEPESNDPVKLFSLEDSHPQTRPFKLVFHGDECDVHELSRNAITEHVLAQIMALRPPCPKGTPRVIFQSPNVGTYSSRLITGPAVHALKLSFLQLISKMAQQGGGVYNRTIKLKPDFSQLLMLKYATGNILCDRCLDGIVGYRIRPHNQKKTFVFVANSNDFHADEPADEEESSLQVMKMDYADTSKEGARIVVRDTQACADDEDTCFGGQDLSPCEAGGDDEDEDEAPAISLNMTVQGINNAVSKFFSDKLLEHHTCHLFNPYCQMVEQNQQEAALSTQFRALMGG